MTISNGYRFDSLVFDRGNNNLICFNRATRKSGRWKPISVWYEDKLILVFVFNDEYWKTRKCICHDYLKGGFRKVWRNRKRTDNKMTTKHHTENKNSWENTTGSLSNGSCLRKYKCGCVFFHTNMVACFDFIECTAKTNSNTKS